MLLLFFLLWAFLRVSTIIIVITLPTLYFLSWFRYCYCHYFSYLIYIINLHYFSLLLAERGGTLFRNLFKGIT